MISFSPQSAIGRLLLLRTIAILIQLLLVLASAFWFDKSIELLPVLIVIAFESCFQLFSVLAYRKTSEAAPSGMMLQLLADVIFMTILLSLSGGASNAFVSMLIIPIVIAAVTLPSQFVLIISLSSLIAYGYLFATMGGNHMHHMDMELHFKGMWANFVLSVFIVVMVVMAMAKQLRTKEQSLAKVREKQLKNEQLIALGSAAAQATHQLATPLGNINLLFEELKEDYPEHPALEDMGKAINICKEQLELFRAQTERFKSSDSFGVQSTASILEELETLMALQFPEQNLTMDDVADADVSDDPMLIPALLNVLSNAAQANNKTNSKEIIIKSKIEKGTWVLSITDHGPGIDPKKMERLGHTIVKSESGLGMALVLSHASIERLKGAIQLENQYQYGAKTTISLPIKENKL
ncbi:ATP-binding protein [Pseudoalteromonas phenolica]|uniref:histidine kinase n=1 Tax=Pseudoalteromonas phenolica TaxID=161398 RepID=A0A0S2K889_9GAMM|nr:HAMP domain-containing sensor histidine kinase [Pseudoalteromonas phenolica]ALO44566.1 Putative sensor histidine kinase [Pseudoalteromonas phenolica]MBE0357597.1 two-component system, sensor histidine kinase RegB [Pseudoalteromonas phenolica O-BC30]RXF02600.1 sensor histidine kinase [Pseudoalteromonas phenolica O-BC30]TMO55610.1 sensor histidine kinase [Pseudoalteromonas phenolica]